MSEIEQMIGDLVRQEAADVPGRQPGEQEKKGCPDGGACHHLCREHCWRVSFCGPLSGYGERWTAEDRQRHAPDVP